MKIKSAMQSRTVWCGIITFTVAVLKLFWPESAALDDLIQIKEVLAGKLILIAQGVIGVLTIYFRVKAKNRD